MQLLWHRNTIFANKVSVKVGGFELRLGLVIEAAIGAALIDGRQQPGFGGAPLSRPRAWGAPASIRSTLDIYHQIGYHAARFAL
jgi:hypothetical protein